MTNKKHTAPRVSVVMPVYNAERFLKQSIDSLLDQTYGDFEIIAIDDGSTDKSGVILDEYRKKDARLVVVHQANTGIVGALNRGLGMARGEYIARQDSDDISFRTRLEEQVKILEQQSKVVLVTGGFEVFDEDDEYLYREVLPPDDEDIKRAMYLYNPIGHGSVMFRKAACKEAGLYSDSWGPTEDFELWCRLAALGEFAAIDSPTFHWRVNPAGITTNNNALQVHIMKGHIERLWQKSVPRVIGARELRKRGQYYYKYHRKHGVAMKNIMLSNNAQLGVKMIRHGHFLAGCHQVVAVALVGRSGVRAVMQRLYFIHRGTLQAIRRRLAFSQ